MNPFLILLLVLLAAGAGYAVGVLRSRTRLSAALEQARAEAAAATARLDSERRHAAEAMQTQAATLRAEFRSIATELAHNETQALRTENIHTLEALLRPLGKDIETFREQFLKGHAAMDRYVRDLIEQTSAIGHEAEELAKALKGNNKLQGNWGEAILSNLLAASGLTEGRDYTLQTHTFDEEGRQLIPDVVVHLPDDRHLIIDSKVSLTAFVDYANAEDEAERSRRLKEHVASVRRHVTELSAKDYDRTVKGSIGYVLMFVPNEAAYIAAVTADTRLTTDAYARRIILLNPTNLLMALQLTYNLWQSELQSRNVREIYASAERLYKKFSLFSDNFVRIGESIDRLSDLYARTKGQLSTGRGNIVSQLEGWKKKGLTPSSEIHAALRHDDRGQEEPEGTEAD